MKNSDDDSPTPEQIKTQGGVTGPLTANEIQSLREEMERDGEWMKDELKRRKAQKKMATHNARYV
ncbi:hypothetical protein ACOI7N_27270 [Pseudomonas sp. P2758]|uniref:hypothetical protein n=1 Tax=Pseudomonas sp. P2758 TaxID=3409916 RepID=UPI003B5B353B